MAAGRGHLWAPASLAEARVGVFAEGSESPVLDVQLNVHLLQGKEESGKTCRSKSSCVHFTQRSKTSSCLSYEMNVEKKAELQETKPEALSEVEEGE